MTALCQFCARMITGPAIAGDPPTAKDVEQAYSQLSRLVAYHMSSQHEGIAAEITAMMGLTGAAVAMRYVEGGSDGAVDSERIRAADELIMALRPKPQSVIISLAS